jgi:ABC-type uncharacterized transport system permease subunit
MTKALVQLIKARLAEETAKQRREALTSKAIQEALDLYSDSLKADSPSSHIVFATELPDGRMGTVQIRFVTTKPTPKNNTALAQIEELLDYNINQLRQIASHRKQIDSYDDAIYDLKFKVEQFQKQIDILVLERMHYCQDNSDDVDQLVADREEVIANCTVKQPQLAVSFKG